MMKRSIVFLKDEVHVMMNKKDRLMKEVHVMMNKKEKAYERRRGSHRNSESGQKASIKRKGSLHEDKSRENTAQRILR